MAELPIVSDVTYESRWIEMGTILQNGLDDSGIDVLQADPEILENMADILREMQRESTYEEKAVD